MGRTASGNYTAPNTQFQWADTDNDLFDREWDLYFLAQAVEFHTHDGVGRGKPVEAVVDGLLHTNAYEPNSIPGTAYMDGSITNGKIQDRTIAPIKLTYDPMEKDGGTMRGWLTMSFASNPNVGGILFAAPPTQQASIVWNGSQWIFNNPVNGSQMFFQSDVNVTRPGTSTGYIFFPGGNYLGFNGSQLVGTGNQPINFGTTIGVPMYGQIGVPTPDYIPTDGRWAQVTDAAGRILAMEGTMYAGSGVTLPRGYVGTDWTLTAHLGTSHNLATAGNPATVVDTGGVSNAQNFYTSNVGSTGPNATLTPNPQHAHQTTVPASGGTVTGSVTLTNKDARIYPPMYTIVLIRRVN